MFDSSTRGMRRFAAATAVVAAAATLAGGLGAATAEAADMTADDVTFEWAVNQESGGGAYFGGCNFLSAGVAGDSGSSTLWNEAKGLYKQQDGNVEILKPDASGAMQPTSWATKCQNQYGTSINGRTAGQTFDVASPSEGAPKTQPTYTGNIVRISDGAGTLDPETDSAHLEWKGSFTVVYYGGMTYWSVSDPVLDVVDGKGTITALASGYGADMDDPTIWKKLDDQTIHLADLDHVDVTDSGITVTPDYLGVKVADDVAGRNPQATQDDTNESWWGSFPDSWLRYAELTGQSSYWYTSSGGVKTIQPRKPTEPIVIGYTAKAVATTPEAPAKPSAKLKAGSDPYAAEVTWQAPDDGGSPITGYAITLTGSDGSVQTQDAAADATAATFGSLKAADVSYTASVTAKNEKGSSPASISSDPVTPNPSPTTEPKLTVTPASGIDPETENTFTVTGTGYTGGAGVYGVYVVIADTDVWQPGKNPSGSSDFVQAAWVQAKDVVDGAFSTTVTLPANKLAYGKQYAVGTMAAHQLSLTDRRFDAAQPLAMKAQPQAPQTPAKAQLGATSTTSVNVTWQAPDDGGSPITGYAVTLNGSDGTSQNQEVAGGVTTAAFTVPGTPGVSYTATVAAKNIKGSSTASEPSEAIAPAPATSPTEPTDVSIASTKAPGELLVTWSRPTNDGGSPITGYVVTLRALNGQTADASDAKTQESDAATSDSTTVGTHQVDANTFSDSFTGLDSSKRYIATVSAVNALGSSNAQLPADEDSGAQGVSPITADDTNDTGNTTDDVADHTQHNTGTDANTGGSNDADGQLASTGVAITGVAAIASALLCLAIAMSWLKRHHASVAK